MRVQMVRTPSGFIPETERDTETLRRVAMGASISAEVRLPRNPAHHRKAFSMLQAVFENQDQFDDFDRFYDAVKIRAGLVDLVEINERGAVYRVKSLAFDRMDQIEFDAVYERLITVAAEKFGAEWAITQYG